MSILTDLMATVTQIKMRLNGLSNRMFDVERTAITSMCAASISNYDPATDIYLTVEYKRADETLALRSVVSNLNPTTNLYMQRTEYYYNSAGATIIRTVVYSLAYDETGRPTSETIISVTT